MAVSLQNRGIVFSTTIAQNYDINYGLKINEFSNEFATAYEAKTRVPTAEKVEYYALIFNKFFPADLDKINTYITIKDKTIQEMMEFGRVQTQKSESLCCIFKKPVGVKLSELIRRNKHIEQNFVTVHIFNQLNAALSILHSHHIMHGGINLENIYFNPQTNNITLRECVSEFPGFSQKSIYETIERMVCHPAAKSHREPAADYYAAGVTLIGLIYGKEPLSELTDDIAKKIKFENGSYEAIVDFSKAGTTVPELAPKNIILLRGLLHDKIKERWGAKQINGWQRKEITSPAPSRVHRQSATSYNFEDQDYFSPKYLAYVFQQNWTIAKKNIKLPELLRWIAFTSRHVDIEKRLSMMGRDGQTEVIIPDDKLTRLIYLLDEDGPIRYKDISFHPDGLGNLLAYYMFKNDQNSIENLITAIDFGFIEGWISGQENQDLYKSNSLGWNPRKIKTFFRKNELGFGIERCLYELNPYLPCLSPILENTYSVGLPAVLTALNQGRLNNKEIENDRHLTSYIFSQTDLEDGIKVKSLQNFPYFSRSVPIKICAMFAIAQRASGIDTLPGIAAWIKQNLAPVIDKLNSNNIKKNVIASLDSAVATGNIDKIFSVLSDAKTIKKDVYGFQEAKRQYKVLSFEILKLKSQHSIDQLAYQMGLRISVILAYLVSAVAILSVVFLHF